MIFLTRLFVYISHLGISKKVKDKYDHIEPMLDNQGNNVSQACRDHRRLLLQEY